MRGAFEASRDASDDFDVVSCGGFGAMAAEEFDTPVLADFGAGTEQDSADLAGSPNVGPPTGLQIDAGDFDRTERTGALDLFADAQLRKLLGGAVADGNFPVFEDDSVGGTRRTFENLRSGLRTAQVDGADGFAEMEGNGGQAKALLENGGEKVLTGVLLHMVEAARPVDAGVNAAGGNGAINYVENVVVFQVADIEDIGFAKFAEIVGLAAGSGIELGLIEEYAPAGSVVAGKRIRKGLTAENLGGEIVLKRVIVVEAASGHGSLVRASLAQEIFAIFGNRGWMRAVFGG